MHISTHGADLRPLSEQRISILYFGELEERFRKDRFIGIRREELEGFFGREGEDRSDKTQEHRRDEIERGLRGSAGKTLGAGCIEAVFEYVEVEAPQIGRSESLQQRYHIVEAVGTVLDKHALLEIGGIGNGPAVKFEHVFDRHGILFHRKVGRVGKQEAQRVANAAVRLNDTVNDRRTKAQLTRIVGRGNPQTQNFGAVLVIDFLRTDDVAFGLRHLLALFINAETVGEKLVVRRTAVEHRAREQRRMEPAAMLVRSFKIEVCRPSENVLVRTAHDCIVGRAGIEPDVENVG